MQEYRAAKMHYLKSKYRNALNMFPTLVVQFQMIATFVALKSYF